MKPKINKVLMVSSILTALGSSLCCILPLLAFCLGAIGITSASSWVEHLRPYLIVLTALILGFTWYRKLRHQEHHCATHKTSSFWQSKTFLGITTAFALTTLGLPYYAPLLHPSSPSKGLVVVEENIEEVILGVQGMHCTGCVVSLQRAIHQLPGIITTSISRKKGTIQVRFDKSKTRTQEIQRMVHAAGYTCAPI